MKGKTIHILCPEYVPLENKGEEAIIRGTEDVVFGQFGERCEYHIVDMNISEYKFVNGLHLHPGRLFFSDWRSREFGLGPSLEQIYSSMCSLVRNGLNKFFPVWIKKPHKEARELKNYLSGKKNPPKKYQKSIEVLKEVDYVIAGHNGGLDEYVCHLVNELYSIGIPYGIFGSSMKPNVKEKQILNVFRKTFKNSHYNIARNPVGYNWALRNFPESSFELNPDPAFGMFPEDENEIQKVIEENDLKSLFEKPVVMFTTAEPAPISRHSFESKVGSSQKIIAHREFLAQLLKEIYNGFDVNFIFLPHTIGPNKQMDDRLISADAIERAGLTGDARVRLLTADLTAKQLKGLISKADFLVAERVHSIIGAVGVCTPFMSLASDKDTRVQGILKEQMKLEDLVFSLKNPQIQDAVNFYNKLYTNRFEIKKRLESLNVRIKEELNPTGQKINRVIKDSIK